MLIALQPAALDTQINPVEESAIPVASITQRPAQEDLPRPPAPAVGTSDHDDGKGKPYADDDKMDTDSQRSSARGSAEPPPSSLVETNTPMPTGTSGSHAPSVVPSLASSRPSRRFVIDYVEVPPPFRNLTKLMGRKRKQPSPSPLSPSPATIRIKKNGATKRMVPMMSVDLYSELLAAKDTEFSALGAAQEKTDKVCQLVSCPSFC
jgi:hypothetical protein